MVVSVENPPRRQLRQGPQLVEELLSLSMGGACVDDEDSFASDHNADIEIQRFVTTPVYALSDFLPHAFPLSDRTPDSSVTGKIP